MHANGPLAPPGGPSCVRRTLGLREMRVKFESVGERVCNSSNEAGQAYKRSVGSRVPERVLEQRA